MKQRNEALSRLDKLVGLWDTAPIVDGVQVMRGTMEYAWVEDQAFMVQRARNEILDTTPDLWRENAPVQTVSTIGLDDATGDFTVLYADSRDVFRVYRMTFDGRVMTMTRQAPGFHQRFTAELSDDGEMMTGRWEKSGSGKDWELDFDMTVTRVR